MQVKIGYLLHCCPEPFHLKTCQGLSRTPEEAKGMRRKSSTFWMVWVIQWVLSRFRVCWPGDLNMIGLQVLGREEIRGIAHEVVSPEGFWEGYDISDAWRSSDKAYQSVQPCE